jgi:hypothetical protein
MDKEHDVELARAETCFELDDQLEEGYRAMQIDNLRFAELAVALSSEWLADEPDLCSMSDGEPIG